MQPQARRPPAGINLDLLHPGTHRDMGPVHVPPAVIAPGPYRATTRSPQPYSQDTTPPLGPRSSTPRGGCAARSRRARDSRARSRSLHRGQQVQVLIHRAPRPAREQRCGPTTTGVRCGEVWDRLAARRSDGATRPAASRSQPREHRSGKHVRRPAAHPSHSPSASNNRVTAGFSSASTQQ